MKLQLALLATLPIQVEAIIYSSLFTQPQLLNFAKMCHNSYLNPDSQEWHELDDNWNNYYTSIIHKTRGIRGYIFHNHDDSEIAIAIKGTSATFYGIGGDESSYDDKFNDNLMFSCCCAHGKASVCTCNRPNNVCDKQCLRDTLSQSYYQSALDTIDQLRQEYPHKKITLTGHSLGGAIASLVGATMGIPTVTFEAPGDALFAIKTDLSVQYQHQVYQYGLDDDPIFTGKCDSTFSICHISGYIMESKCHLGYTCVLDQDQQQDDKPEQKGIFHHRMKYIINNIIDIPDYKTPVCKKNTECRDCVDWSFLDSHERLVVEI